MIRCTCMVAALLLFSCPVYAQVLELPGDLIGLVGFDKEATVRLDTEDLLIEAYSFDVCHDEDIISITEEDLLLGASIVDVEFDTHIVTVEDTAWGVSAVLDGSTLGEGLDSTELEMYLATYELVGAGTSDLTFCGEIEVANAVVDGEDTEFELITGSIEVRKDGAVFKRGDVDGDGVVHPLVDGYGALLWAAGRGPAPACLHGADADNSGAVSGIPDGLRLLNWGSSNALTPPSPGPFECGPDPEGDEIECEEADVCEDDGPTFVDPEDASITIRVSVAAGEIDDEVELTLGMTGSTEYEVVGYQFGVCHDESLTLDYDDGDSVDHPTRDDPGFLFESVHLYETGWTAAATVSILTEVDVSEQFELYTVTYTVGSDDEAVVELCDFGDLYVISPEILLRDADEEELLLAIPESIPGGVNVPKQPGAFLRGDINGNGNVSAIPDAVYLFRYSLLEGEAPPCDDAADVDGDNSVSVFDDALTLLKWEFQDGHAPPHPGPNDCGFDDDGDDLSCEKPPPCK